MRNIDHGHIGYGRAGIHGLLRGSVTLQLSRSMSCILLALSLVLMGGLGGCGGSAEDGQPSNTAERTSATGPPPPPPRGPTVNPPQTLPPPTQTTTTTLPPDSDTTTSPT